LPQTLSYPYIKATVTVNCSSYRPISLLSVPDKVFAHVLLGRLHPLLTSQSRPINHRFIRCRTFSVASLVTYLTS